MADEYDFAPQEPQKRGKSEEEPQPRRKPAEAEAAKPARAAITPDLPERTCPHCGFKIFGKAAKSRCPECAAPLDAVATDLLQFSDPAWVRWISLGMVLLGFAIFGQMAAVVVGWLVKVQLGSYLHIAAATFGLVALVIASAPEPGNKASGTVLGARVSALAAAVAAVILTAVTLKLIAAKVEEVTLSMRVWKMAMLAAFAMEAALAGAYLRKIAIRVPADGLAGQLLNLSWIVPAACVLMIVLQVFNMADRAHMILFFCAFPMMGGLVAVGAWAAIVVMMTGMAAKQCADAAADIEFRKQERLAKEKQNRR